MKKLLLIWILAFMPVLGFAEGSYENLNLGIPFIGNGNMVTTEKSFPAFDSIYINRNATVYFHKSPEYRALITVDSNLQEYIRVEVIDGVLRIGAIMGRLYLFTKYDVHVYCPGITGVSIYGAANFEGMDKISTSTFTANISGVGKIEGSFECADFIVGISGMGEIRAHVESDSLKIDASGTGSITLAGSTEELILNVSGAGDFSGYELQVTNVTLQLTGAARIHVWVLENLKASVSGGGMIRYRGAPRIDFQGSLLGRIEKE